jgi:hypothetical protein
MWEGARMPGCEHLTLWSDAYMECLGRQTQSQNAINCSISKSLKGSVTLDFRPLVFSSIPLGSLINGLYHLCMDGWDLQTFANK